METVQVPPPVRQSFVETVLPLATAFARKASWYLSCPGKRDDFVQEVLLHAWAAWLYLWRAGKAEAVHPRSIARVAVKRAKCGLSHHGCGRQGRRVNNDALAWQVQRRAGFRVSTVGMVVDEERGTDWQSAFRDKRTNVWEQAGFNLDFRAWLETRTPKERAVIALLAEGHRAYRAAPLAGVSPSWICKRQITWLRSWRRFHGEKV